MIDAVAAQLLDALRGHLAQPDLEYVDEPRRLTGGYYTDNRAFRVTANDREWSRPLVLRLFPREGSPDQVRREAAVQTALVEQGFPAPKVLWWQQDPQPLGRRFLVMELLPGRAPLGGAEVTAVLRSVPWLVGRMPRALAEIQVSLHRLDADPLVAALDDLPAGVERWLDWLDEAVVEHAPELRTAAAWLRSHRPRSDARNVICHGDLWAGNLLYERKCLRGVIDWSVATVGEPALDVGFTAMSLSIAPIGVGPRLGRILTRVSEWLCHRYVNAYTSLSDIDLSNQGYYEALRCAGELIGVVEHRRALAEGLERDTPAPTWDVATDRMIEYFEARSGVRFELPPRVVL